MATKQTPQLEMTYSDILNALKKPEVKAATVKNRDFPSLLKYLDKNGFRQRLYINYNATPGYTEIKK